MGGANKNLDLRSLLKIIPRHCRRVILLPGTGTDKLPGQFKRNCVRVNNLKEAVREAFKLAHRGETVLMSPAFASFGLFKNEFDRGAQFNRLVREV